MEFININKINRVLKKPICIDESICASMTYNFALYLPYSMDFCDEDFVIGDFMNIIPISRESHMFKDYGTVYKGLLNFDNLRMDAIIIKICSIFQNMLIYGNSANEFNNDDYIIYGFDKLTNNKDENLRIFLSLKELPKYVERVNYALDTDERRKLLEDVYGYIYTAVKCIEIKRGHIGINIGSFCIDMENLFYYNHINFNEDISSFNEVFKDCITSGLERGNKVRVKR